MLVNISMESQMIKRLIALYLLLLAATQAQSRADDILVEGIPLPARFATSDFGNSDSPLIGAWFGKWDNVLSSILLIEAIDDSNEISAIYGIASNAEQNIQASWQQLSGKLDGRQLRFNTEHFSLQATLSNSGKLKAIFANASGFAVYSRQDLSDIINSDVPVRWSEAEQIMLTTGLQEDKRPIKLEAIVYAPPGPGPFPLAVLNHGSTGSGTDASIAAYSFSNDWLAETLNEHGYLVAFVQRRGRGKSNGLYDEGFSENRKHGYSCDTERSLAGSERALIDIKAAVSALQLQPNVDASPVLLLGNSRGGVLSIAYAGQNPNTTAGVVNFVGGWMGEPCKNASTINKHLFQQGGSYSGNTLWIYGEQDTYYSIEHSRANFDAFKAAGGKGEFHTVKVAGQNNGHWAMFIPPLWESQLNNYLDHLGSP